MSCQSPKSAGASTKVGQFMVDQGPRYENQVINRRSKIIRPDKRRKKRKFL